MSHRLLVLVLLAACSRFASAEIPASLTAPEREAALRLEGDAVRGKEVFSECAGCHRKDASGRTNGTIPGLAGQHASVIRKQLLDIRTGKRINPLMAPVLEDPELSLQAIADVATYLASLPASAAPDKGPGNLTELGKALYAEDCASCHGARGEGAAAKSSPRVAGQHYAYLLRELNLIRDGARGNSDPEMVALLKRRTAAELEALADYLAQLHAD